MEEDAKQEYRNDYNELLGNNDRSNSTNSSVTSEKIYAEKFGGYRNGSGLSTTDEASGDSVELGNGQRRGKLKKKRSNAYFLSQASQSGSDSEGEEEEGRDGKL